MIQLTDEIRQHVNGALVAATPMIMAAVDPEGRPRMSFRGSIQVFSDTQLGFWARNAEGETLEAIQKNPNVAMMYRSPATRATLQFIGRARIAQGAERDQVYESAPEFEQKADPERKGVGVIVDLDRVDGILGLDDQGQRRPVRLRRD